MKNDWKIIETGC